MYVSATSYLILVFFFVQTEAGSDESLGVHGSQALHHGACAVECARQFSCERPCGTSARVVLPHSVTVRRHQTRHERPLEQA